MKKLDIDTVYCLKKLSVVQKESIFNYLRELEGDDWCSIDHFVRKAESLEYIRGEWNPESNKEEKVCATTLFETYIKEGRYYKCVKTLVGFETHFKVRKTYFCHKDRFLQGEHYGLIIEGKVDYSDCFIEVKEDKELESMLKAECTKEVSPKTAEDIFKLGGQVKEPNLAEVHRDWSIRSSELDNPYYFYKGNFYEHLGVTKVKCKETREWYDAEVYKEVNSNTDNPTYTRETKDFHDKFKKVKF